MARFLVSRLLQSLFVLWGVASIVFVLVRVIGNPAALMLPLDATPAEVASLSEALGLSAPLHEQYGRFLGDLLRGDLGRSVWMKVPTIGLIAEFLPPSLLLALITISIGLTVGVLLGVIAAVRPNSVADRLVTFLSFASISLPEFWLGLVLITFVAGQLRLLPTSGFNGGEYLVLPVLTLVARPIGRLAQITRSTVLGQLSMHYVVTARAKGLTSQTVTIQHVLRNASLGIITLAADEAAAIVTGAVIVETVFAWPGIGRLTIQAIQHRDAQLVVATVLVLSAVVLLLNLFVDVLYAWMDPRIKVR